MRYATGPRMWARDFPDLYLQPNDKLKRIEGRETQMAWNSRRR